LRADKIRLAALEATLKLYRDPDRLPEKLPALKSFVRPRADIALAANRVLAPLQSAIGPAFSVELVECSSQIGSGSLPLETLPSAGLAIKTVGRKGHGRLLQAVTSAFRKLPIPVIGRIRDGALIFDLRCLEDENAFISQLPSLHADPVENGLAPITTSP
jgi:L-seryl-tRNA(Ser) seleniumtransferase